MKVFFALALGLMLALFLSVCLGTESFSPVEVARVVMAHFGLAEASPLPSPHQTVILHIRFPRAILGALIGAALAASGVVMQGLFRNPLADPGIIGVSAGGAFGAVLALFFGWTTSMLVLPIASLIGSIACAFLAFGISIRGGRAPIVTLLLAGVAINSLAGSGTSLLLVISDSFMMRDILGWLMGSLDARTWSHVLVAAPFIIGGSAASFLIARPLDILSQGEEVAASLGVNVGRLRIIAIICACLSAGGAVAVSGIVGFVGIVVPHIMRSIVGPSHARLLAASILGGAILLLLADTTSRILPGGGSIRLGIITSFIGVPFFLTLMRSTTSRENYA